MSSFNRLKQNVEHIRQDINMIYALIFSGLIHVVVMFWYDLAMEDQYLRNHKLTSKEQEIVHSLILKNMSIRFVFRMSMFSPASWRINKRITNCLRMYFFSVIQLDILIVMYFMFN